EGRKTDEGQGKKMTLSVKPMSDAFTTGAPEQITVTVEDSAGGQSSLTFNVEVTPVNDAPSFVMNCDELTVNKQVYDIHPNDPNAFQCTNPLNQSNNYEQTEGVFNGYTLVQKFIPGP